MSGPSVDSMIRSSTEGSSLLSVESHDAASVSDGLRSGTIVETKRKWRENKT